MNVKIFFRKLFNFYANIADAGSLKQLKIILTIIALTRGQLVAFLFLARILGRNLLPNVFHTEQFLVRSYLWLQTPQQLSPIYHPKLSQTLGNGSFAALNNKLFYNFLSEKKGKDFWENVIRICWNVRMRMNINKTLFLVFDLERYIFHI